MVLLLAIIYLSFISLGLPDSLLGSAWPSMYPGLGVPLSGAGAVSMIISAGTIISSLLCDRAVRRFGVGPVTFISVGMTAAALVGFSFSGRFALLCLFAVPLGLGAGSVDAALNNFVALHYKAKHMNWLHCFWGVGASLGPVIMAFCLNRFETWNSGYLAVGCIQLVLAAALLFSIPLWKTAETSKNPENASKPGSAPFRELIGLKYAGRTLLMFFCYCAVESTAGLWGSSYLVTARGVPAETASGWISLYYLGITLGRFCSGFLAMRLKNTRMIRLGLAVVAAGVALLFPPLGSGFSLAGFFLTGVGCAPIFPSLLHETPQSFGAAHSQSMIGLQMAAAYVGTTVTPPLFGVLASKTGYGSLPAYLLVFLVTMILMTRQIKPVKHAGTAA